jgi:hypothetical protein
MYTQPTMDSVQNFISSAAPLEVEVLVSQGLALIMMVCFVRAARIPGSTNTQKPWWMGKRHIKHT